ncbi:hypothetical protein [Pseudomonas donghuensis]|uniref:hypothetical protein n=1 Tax=Pseudomonas donghuensis TaxID=1163398 RepID=UPI00215E15A7|nr:hypothetical protein [Pseudomonas donghuensis]UVL26863.1 hypothetical protein LOY30_13085 [Pseudomonas donghuensis]
MNDEDKKLELTPSKQASNGSKVNFRCSPTDAHGIKSIYGTPPKNSVIPFGNSGLGYVLESMGGQDESTLHTAGLARHSQWILHIV